MSIAQPLPASESRMAAEVVAGLQRPGQKTLPCKYFYDAVGSILFDAISALPEYGLTAADERLLQRHAAEMVAPFTFSGRRQELALPLRRGGSAPGLWVAELGSGSGRKTRWVLEAACRSGPAHYLPIEVSPRALERCQRELAGIAGLRLQPLACEYLEGIAQLARLRSERPEFPLLVLFLGSSLGNFEPRAARAFLSQLRSALRPGAGLLLGLDLDKDPALLRAAYDDPAGVTAAFNLNLLARINRELEADFDLRHWRHEVRSRRRPRRIEMHLRSRRRQSVHIAAAGVTIAFRRGETIWTESSHKYRAAEVAALAGDTGFRLERQWLDASWPFAESLLVAD